MDNFRLSGEGEEDIKISKDGWLYLEKPLDWSRDDNYIVKVIWSPFTPHKGYSHAQQEQLQMY